MLLILELKWEQITMDFVSGPPQTFHDFDGIWVIVDWLTKSAYFIPIQMSFSTERLARIYIHAIFYSNGVPISVISDSVQYYF